MSEELKPCPFCGSTARLESNRDWHRIIIDHDERCIFLEPEVCMVPATDEQMQIAIADWNRRSAPSDFDALQQRCREANSLADQWAEKNEKLAQRCRGLEAQVNTFSAERFRIGKENADLRAEVELLRKDAARYYWLRDHWHGFDYLRHGVIPGVTVESEIDRVMARSISEAPR